MFKIIAITVASAAAFVSTAAAASENEKRFTRDGETYVYITKASDSGTVIEGRRYPSGSAFRLVIRGTRVTGQSGGHDVAFRISDTKGATQLASK